MACSDHIIERTSSLGLASSMAKAASLISSMASSRRLVTSSSLLFNVRNYSSQFQAIRDKRHGNLPLSW